MIDIATRRAATAYAKGNLDKVEGFLAGFAYATEHSVAEIEVTESDFNYWWNLYDKKCGCKKCKAKWAKMSKQDRRKCIEATPIYVAATPDKQYRKHPLTYLNGECWNDEIIQNNGTYQQEQERQQRISNAAAVIAKLQEGDMFAKE